MSKSIGGYFELELTPRGHFHKTAYRLGSARNCFECILTARRWRKVFLPYYSCNVILQPIERLGIKYEFYHINASLDPVDFPVLMKDEAFLYTNYFGLKQATVNLLADFYGNQLIIDNAQAFYSSWIDGIDTFYSPRKFFGVPDGGYLYSDFLSVTELERDDSSWMRSTHLLRRIDQNPEMGYDDFRRAEESLDNAPIRLMSKLSDTILASVDYPFIALKRRQNYQLLKEVFADRNPVLQGELGDEVPMVFPFLSNQGKRLRSALLSHHVYLARYWPNVQEWCSSGIESEYVDDLLPLPIDQRLGIDEMNSIIEIIHKNE